MYLLLILSLAFIVNAICREIDRHDAPESQPQASCPGCQGAVETGWLACPHCRELLQTVCGHCGHSHARNGAFCPWCGSVKEKPHA